MSDLLLSYCRTSVVESPLSHVSLLYFPRFSFQVRVVCEVEEVLKRLQNQPWVFL